MQLGRRGKDSFYSWQGFWNTLILKVYIFEASSSLTSWFITLVESWHGRESGDQDCEEASPDRTHRDQAQQGQ